MEELQVVSLLVGVVGALAAVGAWLVAVSAREDSARSAAAAERSADAAERSAAAGEKQAEEDRCANHLARTPAVEIATNGTVQRGVELFVTSSTDLDTLRIEIVADPQGNPEQHDKLGRPVWVDLQTLITDNPVSGQASNGLAIGPVTAGQQYWISGQWSERYTRPRRVRSAFKC